MVMDGDKTVTSVSLLVSVGQVTSFSVTLAVAITV